MQEIKKRRIVIASVLKPVDDSRMFEKIGRSLATVHEVHVIGFGALTSLQPSAPTLHAIGEFPRISMKRITAPWRILRMILKLKPDILIVCTHELLVQALITRLFTGCRVWYDVQENYSANILHTNTFPRLLRPLIAAYIRIKERFASSFVERFLLAETSYRQEMPYLHVGIVIENKMRRELAEAYREKTAGYVSNNGTRLVFTGTLSESTGVYAAIEIASELHKIDSGVMLTITGFCPRISDFERLRATCLERPFITLKGGDRLIPHQEVLNQIAQADFGMITYPRNPSTWDSIPTKLYEYLGMKVPIIMAANPKWMSLADRYTAAIAVDFDNFSALAVASRMRSTHFYPTDPEDVYWESEEQKLFTLI
jgi:hypothetical protein